MVDWVEPTACRNAILVRRDGSGRVAERFRFGGSARLLRATIRRKSRLTTTGTRHTESRLGQDFLRVPAGNP